MKQASFLVKTGHRFILAVCLVLVSIISGHAATHPRLFFTADDIPGFQAKADQYPWKDMLETAKIAAVVPSGGNLWIPRAQYFAALYLFTNDPVYADKARDMALMILSGNGMMNPENDSSLTLGTQSTPLAITYDICYNAWVGQTVPATVTNWFDNTTYTVNAKWVGMDLNAAVSQALRDNANNLIASGGGGWPGDDGHSNNWHGVRYGGAILGYLATDDTVDADKFNTATGNLSRYFKANLGEGTDSRGWNVEGIGYLSFPGQTSLPAVLALQRNTNTALGGPRNLVDEVPAIKYTTQTLFPGAIAQNIRHPYRHDFTGIGVRPDFNDDHPLLFPGGCAMLGFALVPDEYKPGMKWMVHRFFGENGDQTWDSLEGGSIWGLLYYPAGLTEQNPADSWGLSWGDPSHGMYVLRNRYQDVNDRLPGHRQPPPQPRRPQRLRWPLFPPLVPRRAVGRRCRPHLDRPLQRPDHHRPRTVRGSAHPADHPH